MWFCRTQHRNQSVVSTLTWEIDSHDTKQQLTGEVYQNSLLLPVSWATGTQKPWFSKFHELRNHLKILLKWRFLFFWSGMESWHHVTLTSSPVMLMQLVMITVWIKGSRTFQFSVAGSQRMGHQEETWPKKRTHRGETASRKGKLDLCRHLLRLYFFSSFLLPFWYDSCRVTKY